MALALSLLFAGGEALAARISCLKCHRSHYREKGSCVGCHGGDPRSERPAIAHHDLVAARFSWSSIPGSAQRERGNKLRDTFACRRCHATAGKGNRLASSLDRLPAGTTPENLAQSIRFPALFMPQFRFDERQAVDLVNAILAGAREAGRNGKESAKETPQVVHFQAKRPGQENVFEKRCGACHRVLTRILGGFGRGGIGPNLSGLMSRHYPRSAAKNSQWSPAALEKWLKNPRESRDATPMRPVPLEKAELERLLELLAEPPQPPSE